MRIKLGIPLSLTEIKTAVGARGTTESRIIEYVSTDSRLCEGGELFIALSGERYDGNSFIREASERGAITLGGKGAELFVENSGAALLSLAAYYRKKLPSLMYTVAVTGSVGKSGTKEFLFEILKKKYKTHKTEGNLNNEIGVPLTVLSAPADTEVLVLEMGMNSRGEIRRLSLMAEPNLAVITNIGTAHVGMLGGIENIALAKLEILEGMKSGAPLIAPLDEALLKKHATVFTAVQNPTAALNLALYKAERDFSEFDVFYMGKYAFSARLSLGGVHHLKNLAHAIAAAFSLRLSESEIKSGVFDISAKNTRQKEVCIKSGRIIDDSYNASLESVSAALSYLSLRSERIKSALLSDILELGDKREEIHEKVGECAASSSIDKLYLSGECRESIKKGALRRGFPEDKIFLIGNNESPAEFAERIYGLFEDGELMLAKASHRTNLGAVLSALIKRSEEEN